jgi:hypothetical protein
LDFDRQKEPFPILLCKEIVKKRFVKPLAKRYRTIVGFRSGTVVGPFWRKIGLEALPEAPMREGVLSAFVWRLAQVRPLRCGTHSKENC